MSAKSPWYWTIMKLNLCFIFFLIAHSIINFLHQMLSILRRFKLLVNWHTQQFCNIFGIKCSLFNFRCKLIRFCIPRKSKLNFAWISNPWFEDKPFNNLWFAPQLQIKSLAKLQTLLFALNKNRSFWQILNRITPRKFVPCGMPLDISIC